MQIKQAKFETSWAGEGEFPGKGVPQIAIAGKSNVGKSSLINMLANHKKLARTSGAPGHTRLINLYGINGEFYLVDLPGYGYAKVSKQMRSDWGTLIQNYLESARDLKGVLLLVDIRHEPGAHDLQMSDWINQAGIPCAVVATKADKLSRMQQQKALNRLVKTLNISSENIVAASSLKRTGKEEILTCLESLLEM